MWHMASMVPSYLAHAAFVGAAAKDIVAVLTQTSSILSVDRLIEHTFMAPAFSEKGSAYSGAMRILRANEMKIGEANAPARTR